MKNILFLIFLILWCLFIEPQTGHCSQKLEEIDPCNLIAAEKFFLTFPALKKADKQTVGQSSVCNYLDNFGLQEGIAALHIKKENISVNLSFFSISVQFNDAKFEEVKVLAAEMLDKF